MKALIINQFGGQEQLQIKEIAIPLPRKGEILVRIHAAGINPVDYKIRNGSLKFIYRGKFPCVLGRDIAGVVEQAGEKSKYRPGDKVFGMLSLNGGGYAEFATVKESHLCHIPEDISMEEAAATPLASLTAHQSLQKGPRINIGDRILINGASGGVGSFAVQIAKAMGAHVTGVCSKKNIEFVQSLGADQVIDYNNEDFTRLNQKFHKVLDAVAKSSFSKCRKILKKGGIYISTLPGKGLLFHKILNYLSNKKADFIMVNPSGNDLILISDFIKKGLVRPHVQKVFPLEEGAQAHTLIETQRVRGKLVLSVIRESNNERMSE